MQIELLHITIIGCLVLLFGSTYRKRPSHVVRAWLLGWVLILVHFAALLVLPRVGSGTAKLLESISLAGLFACGLVFLSAPPGRRLRSHRALVLVLAVAGVAIGACVFMDAWEISSRAAALVAGGVTAAAWVFYGKRLEDVSSVSRSVLFLCVAATGLWLVWAAVHQDVDTVISALLTQVYLVVGVTYTATVRRISAGTLTVSLALVAWAAVFPVASWLTYLHLADGVHPEFWNIPKYFVAFGMMLMLLEDEIVVANRAAKTLSFQARHDQLTGLRNRAALEQDIRDAFERARGLSHKCALISFDLDRFKHVNDTYGHGIGDVCLRTTGERLSRIAFNRYTAARIGGEEFAVLIENVSGLQQAEAFAREILLTLRAPIDAESYCIEVTASIGIALWPDDGKEPTDLWRNADTAMYRAKRNGGNQVAFMSPEVVLSTAEANDMELTLRHALREGGLELWFQPIFFPDGAIHSLEALVRLQHPVLGLVMPSRFIPLAEERGLIVPLGNWVCRQVCVQLAEWKRSGVPLVPIAINISALQITSSNFAAGVSELLAQYDIDPSLVAMEITETAMLRNALEASRQIDTLAAAGVSFLVDDFGVGYSSLGQLDKLHVDYLKIDHSFVSRMCAHSRPRSIVYAIISMAHSLGLQVVAEGIEDKQTLDALLALNCDLFQGFALGRPVPVAEIETLLRGRDERLLPRFHAAPSPEASVAAHGD